MLQTLQTYLCVEILNGEPGSVGVEEDLLAGGLVDSMGMMRLIRYIEAQFDLKIPAEDLVFENFATLEAIGGYLRGRGVESDG